MDLVTVLAALADPMRLGVVAELVRRPDGEHPCSSFDLPVAKSTRTHHWRVLRESGLITQRQLGNGSVVELRRSAIERELPALIDLVAARQHDA